MYTIPNAQAVISRRSGLEVVWGAGRKGKGAVPSPVTCFQLAARGRRSSGASDGAVIRPREGGARP